MMNIICNGEKREIDQGSGVTDLLRLLDLNPDTVVVERNGDILRRNQYETCPLSEGDVLELIRFVGGG